PSGQVQSYRRQLHRSPQLPITNLLSIEDVAEAVAAEGCSFRERIFTPLLTIWVFLGQVLDPDHSCRQAVLRQVGWLAAHDRSCSSNTGAYCKARATAGGCARPADTLDRSQAGKPQSTRLALAWQACAPSRRHDGFPASVSPII